MEIKAELNKPCSDKQKMDFIVEYNHNLGYEIKETPEAIQAWDYDDAEKQQQERERLDNLNMRRGDVFEALILAKGIGKTQIRAMIEQSELDDVTKALYLNRFDEALEFYRGYPIFDMLGKRKELNITGEMLDRFFDTKNYHYLTTCNIKVTLRADEKPETDPIVTINGIETKETTLAYGTTCIIKVECDGYKTLQPEDFTVTENMHIELQLVKEEQVDEEISETVDNK